MSNCKDCKFWDRDWLDSKINMAECNAFGYTVDGTLRKENDAAFELKVTDVYGLTHAFMTGPMFGCVKFQSRD